MVLLGIIATGLIAMMLGVIIGLFTSGGKALPNWAENVLVAMVTAGTLKMGDLINAVVALSTGRQIETFGTKLAASSPQPIAPQTAVDAAHQTAEAADKEAERIAEQGEEL